MSFKIGRKHDFKMLNEKGKKIRTIDSIKLYFIYKQKEKEKTGLQKW
jgi:hypothetical protein